MEYLFSSKKYHQVNAKENLFQEFGSEIVPYFIQNQVVKIPFRSSFFLLENEFDTDKLNDFLVQINTKAISIFWSLAPMNYPKSKENLRFLLDNRFKISKVEVTQYLDLSQDFERNLHKTKRKILKRQKNSNTETKQLDLSFFDECYQMIADVRMRKNYPVTMQSEDLKRLLVSFPDNYLLYGTFMDGKLSACSVTVKLSKTVIYQFYWAHSSDFDDKSPLVYHNYFLACLAKSQGFTIFDFGVSTDAGIINRGLFRFKKELGANPVKKYYLEREI
jgi:hypothetical protein